jgi:hypothetical protein
VLVDCVESFEYLQHECEAPISTALDHAPMPLQGSAESVMHISPRTRHSQQRMRAAVESSPEPLRAQAIDANLSAAVTRAVTDSVRAWLAQVRAALRVRLIGALIAYSAVGCTRRRARRCPTRSPRRSRTWRRGRAAPSRRRPEWESPAAARPTVLGSGVHRRG